MENKFLIGTVFWKRYDLFKMFVRHHQRMGLDILVIGSEGEKSKKFCEDLGCIYIEHPNSPLHLKFNRRVKYFLNQEKYSHLILLGSDDFIDDVVLSEIKELSKKYDVISWKDIYYHNIKNGNSMYSNGYKGTSRSGEPLAPGRCISKKVVKQLKGNLWSTNGPATPDANVWGKLKKVKNKINVSCKEIGGVIVDVKSGINQHSYSLITMLNKHKKLKITENVKKKIKNMMEQSKKEYTVGKNVVIPPNSSIGNNVDISDFVIIEDNVTIGDNTKIGPFSIIRSGAKIGKNCSFTAYCEIRDNVVIGNNTKFGSRCTISANAIIGSNTTVKYGFVLTDTPNLKEGDVKSVKGIGDNSLIGANVCLMPGFSIGDNCIIGACSQVRSDIPVDEIWYGSPAKFYKKNNK